MRILSGDFGGSKTLLQLAKYADDAWEAIAYARYDNHAYADFETILSEFSELDKGFRTPIDSICPAVAGPIKGEKVRLMNRPWSIYADRIRMQVDTHQVHLIYDL